MLLCIKSLKDWMFECLTKRKLQFAGYDALVYAYSYMKTIMKSIITWTIIPSPESEVIVMIAYSISDKQPLENGVWINAPSYTLRHSCGIAPTYPCIQHATALRTLDIAMRWTGKVI